VIPLRPTDPTPDYVELLDNLQLPKERKEEFLIGIWVLNRGKLVAPQMLPLSQVSQPQPPPAQQPALSTFGMNNPLLNLPNVSRPPASQPPASTVKSAGPRCLCASGCF